MDVGNGGRGWTQRPSRPTWMSGMVAVDGLNGHPDRHGRWEWWPWMDSTAIQTDMDVGNGAHVGNNGYPDKRLPPHAALTTALICTRRTFCIAPRMADKFSIVGLPDLDSILCRLLLGLRTLAARDSKPIVALMTSRNTAL